ncbi:DUF732 domain-containing protein [Mycobacterium sp. SM1]|uniref:DUF732 domain-containing protein n=1 Tax=Mycobacterium sp. SM1 TaxID=2816243 RepID=UPI001BCDBD8E|nr:DUF732 domain-containing protein [Mycobacterium sp. SM1]MBS4730525.1 DUF732 domain-containing protein [Mycobacterium sp. SM1]
MDDTPVEQAEDVTTAANTALDAEETVIVPDASSTQMAELAWSTDGPDYTRQWSAMRDAEPEWPCSVADNEPDVKNRRPLLLWCLIVAAVLITAVAAGWFGNVFYYEEQSTQPGKSSAEPPQTTSPTATPQPPRKTPAAGPPPPTVTELLPPPVTITAPPATVAAPSAPPRPGSDADARFLAVISRIFNGAPIPDPSLAITSAHTICVHLREGSTTPRQAALDTMNANPGISFELASLLVEAAIDVYCPQFS